MSTTLNIIKLSEIENRIRTDIPRLSQCTRGCNIVDDEGDVFQILKATDSYYQVETKVFGIVKMYNITEFNNKFTAIGHSVTITNLIEWLLLKFSNENVQITANTGNNMHTIKVVGNHDCYYELCEIEVDMTKQYLDEQPEHTIDTLHQIIAQRYSKI